MLEFYSGSSTAVNSKSALEECVDLALGDVDRAACRLLAIHSTVGHNFKQLTKAAKDYCPNATVIGCTGSGVIGRESVSEAMRAMAVMVIIGDELSVAACDGLNGNNSAVLAEKMARQLHAQDADVNMIYILTAGLDLSGNQVIKGIETVFGPEMPIFGATAGDNGKGVKTFQFHDQEVMERGIILVGFSDPSLETLTGVHHGFTPVEGAVYEVTKSSDNEIIELNGKPAWPTLLERLGLDSMTVVPADTLPITGVGIELSENDQVIYDNTHILSVPVKYADDRQSFFLPITVAAGTKLHLMQRDELQIFEGLDRLMSRMQEEIGDRKPVAVFHADCMARGRFTFNRVLKDEIIAKMQYPICGDEQIPWLGVYGFSEYCRFAGKNRFHSYTTSLFPIFRRADA